MAQMSGPAWKVQEPVAGVLTLFGPVDLNTRPWRLTPLGLALPVHMPLGGSVQPLSDFNRSAGRAGLKAGARAGCWRRVGLWGSGTEAGRQGRQRQAEEDRTEHRVPSLSVWLQVTLTSLLGVHLGWSCRRAHFPALLLREPSSGRGILTKASWCQSVLLLHACCTPSCPWGVLIRH